MLSKRLLFSDTTMATNVSRDNQDSTNLRALHFLSKIALGLVLNLLCLTTVTIGRPKDSVPPAVKIQIADSFSGSLPTDIETHPTFGAGLLSIPRLQRSATWLNLTLTPP
jgi:hypothetical protein